MKKIFLFGLVIIFLISFAYAGDVENAGAKIDFIIDSNVVNTGDYFIGNNIIAVNSIGYEFEKDYQFIDEAVCLQYDFEFINGTKTDTDCSNWDTQHVLDKVVLAKLTFKGCNEGKYYRIYKIDSYTTDKELIKRSGKRFTDVKCVADKLTFEVDSFSSYTSGEISSLQANNVLYYSFDNADLTTGNPNDISSTGNDGVTDGATTGATGIAGEAFSFDGSDDCVALEGNDAFMSSETYLTITGWFYSDGWDTTPLDRETFIRKWSAGKTGFMLNFDNIVVGTSTQIQGLANGESFNTGDQSISTGAWHFLAMGFDGLSKNVEVYVDNSLIYNSSTTITQTGNVAEETGFGCKTDDDSTRSEFFTGDLDEIGIWNRYLSDNEIASIKDINEQGYNIYNYPTGNASISLTRLEQSPPDINLSNIFEGTWVTYNITDYNNTEEIYLNYSLSNGYSCLIYQEGACILENGTYIKTLATTNTSTVFNFSIDEPSIIPAIYNYNYSAMNDAIKTFRSFNTADILRVNFENLTTTCTQAYLEGYFNSSVANDVPIYYCNSSYSSGNPVINANCEQVGVFQDVNETNHRHNKSYHDSTNINFCGSNLTVGFSTNGSFMFIGDTSPVELAYSNLGGTIQSYYSTNNGATYTQETGDYDLHIHFLDDGLNLSYYACGTGLDNVFNCSGVSSDIIDLSDILNIVDVTLTYPLNGASFYNNETINVTWIGFDFRGDPLNYNLSINGSLLVGNITSSFYSVNLSGYLGAVNITIYATDGTLFDSDTHEITVLSSVSVLNGDSFQYGECPIDSTPQSIMFLSICFMLIAFSFIGFLFKSPLVVVISGLGILFMCFYVIGCMGSMAYIFLGVGIGIFLYGAFMKF